jgi:putative ABC transport system permease protein
MGTIWQDIRYGFRVLAKRPGITFIAVLTLALGVGANTAIFSVVDAVLLRPLPYQQPDRLVFLSETSSQVPDMSISMANFNDWRAMNTVFESMAPYNFQPVVLTGQGEAERLQMRQITADLLPTLGVQPVLGRGLTPDDDKVGAAPVVLLSDGYWTRKFARDPNVIGKKLILNGEIFTVVGVVPNSKFHGSWRQYSLFSSLWRQEDTIGGPDRRDEHPGIYAIARMKPGVTLARANAEMKDIAARLARQYPKTNTGNSANADSLLHAIVGDIRPSLLVLLFAVGFVLLIACANVANLMLARASERHREMAIRTALGAGRPRLVRQLLTESILLSVVGGAFGLGIAYLATGALASAAPANVPRIDGVSVNGMVLAYTLGLAIFTGFFFGIFPAWQVSRTDVHEAIKEGGRGSASGGGKRVRAILVVAEVAVSMILLVGAGLMVKSLYRVLVTDPGFNSSGVLTAAITMPDTNYKDLGKQRQFVQQLVDKVSAIPGVQAAGFMNPLLGGNQTSYAVEGRPLPAPGQMASVDITQVTPDALRAMGAHLVQGRFFTQYDTEKSERVCIVDTLMAQIVWPGESAVGKRVAVSGTAEKPEWQTVVGVVAHIKNYGVDQPSREELFQPYAARPRSGGNLLIRASGDTSAIFPAVREIMKSLDPDVPLSQTRVLASIVDDNVSPRRLAVLLLSAFAGLALLLAAVGIYGVMSYMVTQRTQEIGIRIALGAQPRDVLSMVLRSGMALLLLGIAIGLLGAYSLSQFLQSLLFQVTSTDLLTYLSVPVLLTLVALLACYLPARRAMRVDPVIALRSE